jgi:hypothetical protein
VVGEATMDNVYPEHCNEYRWSVNLQRIRLVESEELTSAERKILEDNPEMCAYDVESMVEEVEKRAAEKRRAKISLSSHLA